MFKSRIKRPNLSRPHTSYTAASIAAMYGFPKLTHASTQRVAIISLGGGWSTADVQAYCSRYGFPVPNIRTVSILGATNAYTGDPNSADGENALDIQNVIGATGGLVGIDFYCCPNSNAGFDGGINQVAIDNTACALSISWGSDESNGAQYLDAALQACLAKGIPVFVASGDSGSSDGDPGQNVDYPSSSPYSIGCGGTTITGTGQTAWSSGGGGPSHVYAKPTWQALAPGSMRGVPDVAANADPNTGYPIVIAGQWNTFGGTSAVGPMWAGLTALLVTITGKNLAGLQQTLYQLNNLTDITTGSNGAYKAGVGYDYCTGLGTPNAAFVAAITGATTPPAPPPVTPPPAPPTPPTPPGNPNPPPPTITLPPALLKWLRLLLMLAPPGEAEEILQWIIATFGGLPSGLLRTIPCRMRGE
jgi:kumamolisin